MRYGWDIKEIQRKRDMKLQLNLPNHQEEAEVYDAMLSDYNDEEEIFPSINSHQFKKSLSHFHPVDYQEELESILYFGSQMFGLKISIAPTKLERYSEEETVNLARQYIHKKEPKDYSYFKKIVSKPNRIQFRYLASLETFLGKSYFLSKDEFYILVHSLNGIQDAITLLHEASHVEHYLKFGLNLSALYAELNPMTREHYSFDYFELYDVKTEVDKQRALSLNHYLMHTMKFYHALLFLLQLKQNPNTCHQVLTKYDKFLENFDVGYLYSLLSDNLTIELGYALSFIASLDIYLHTSSGESNLLVTSYQIGTRKLSHRIIDQVVSYLNEKLEPYQKVKQI